MKKIEYEPPKIEEILLLENCFIRTSFGDDGNGDDWEDENAFPNNGF